jgi:hypothetical protein
MRRSLLLSLAALSLLAVPAPDPVAASSHREAPGITKTPKVDGTDFYAFRSYEPGRQAYTTLIANYLPLQDAYGGPNYFNLDPDAVYRILIDNTGDGVEDITFQFRVARLVKDLQIPVGGKNISVPLVNIGAISTPNAAVQNVAESYTVSMLSGPANGWGQGAGQFLKRHGTDIARFGKPLDNIGEKSIPNYAAYAQQFIAEADVPGCNAGTARVFVGQRKDPFAVNLGEVFDLVNIANPLGARDAEPNTIDDKNVTTLAIEVPTACINRNGAAPVIGTWTTAGTRASSTDGSYKQVSRLGLPLVNEIVIGLKDKDKFNGSQPKDDLVNFADYVTNPTLPELLEILFGAAGVRAPNNFPRTDLVATFVTGIEGLNKAGIGEMVRLNTTIPPTASGAQNNLGVLGGDNAGFPNGRRPGDDVVDAELRVAMGVLCHAFPGVFCSPADAPSGNLPFTDGTLQDESQFDAQFPYLKPPIAGSPN